MAILCAKCGFDNPEKTIYCSKCASPLEPGTGAPEAITKTFKTHASGIEIGSVVAGKYKILSEIGAGGMGIVYKAEDIKLERTVALKFLPPELTRVKEAQYRFIQEAKAASALDHANICTIYEINETETGQVFIAMAYYEGKNLKEMLSLKQINRDATIEIAIQVAEGLYRAHQKGIIHRDIKPANIMVTDECVAKLLDFGLAKLSGQVGLTQTQMTMGTVAYMSPEQAQGKALDIRTDIWSLGVVLYEMLTG
jgi:serine/threonine protein kinase